MNVRVMLSAAFNAAYIGPAAPFEGASGHKVESPRLSGVRMMNRLKGGETADPVILSGALLDGLVRAGIARDRAAGGSRLAAGVRPSHEPRVTNKSE